MLVLMKKTIKSILQYIILIFVSLFIALLIRLFLCNFYVVPTDSMEPEIIPGDFIIVNKWIYGARIFTGLKFDRNNDPPMVRVRGFRSIKRNDPLVFNFPYRHGWDTVRMNLEVIFVKRCIALPGDSVSAIGGFYHIAGIIDTFGYIPEQKRMIRNRSFLDSVIIRTVAFDASLGWDVFDFGPFYIPSAGQTIALTPKNFKLYHKQIVFETGAVVHIEDSLVFINNMPAHEYTFRNNWYFIAGDKVMNSQDSRYIGLIPEIFIIGKATRVMSSKDRYSNKYRWNRTLKQII